MTNFCLCGCGTELPPDDRGRSRQWAHGHNGRGKQQSGEWSKNKAAGLRKAWLDLSKFQTMRKQSQELIERRISKLRGRKLSPERNAKVSKALTGRKLSPEHRARSGAVLREMRKVPLPPEIERRRRESISKQRMGKHNYGRAARDRLDHFKALHWIIRDPRGVTHECDNLQAWCRTNEWRFLPDDYPQAKLPLWHRAVGGFNNMQRTDRKASHHWKGWTLVSVLERKTQGAPDLLARTNG